jgi:hypothetical protein
LILAGQLSIKQWQLLEQDPSAWYHCLLHWRNCSKQGIYVNGVLQAVTGTYPAQNTDLAFNQAIAHNIGRYWSGGENLNGYLADVHFIDGQALDPSSFGEFDTNGVWHPIDASGLTYGTNGFHLPFSDNSTAAALGTDTSGNGNDWTVNNIQASDGTIYSRNCALTNPTLLFDGLTATQATHPGAATLTVMSGVSITASSTIRYLTTFNGTNGAVGFTVNPSSGSPVSHTITTADQTFSFTGTISELALGVTTNTFGVYQIWVDGIALVDGTFGDSLVDSPTNYGTDSGAGGEVRGNYCTGNPLNIATNGTGVLKNGNLDCDDSSAGSNYSRFPGTIGVSSGKWYFEAIRTDASGAGNYVGFGVANTETALGTGVYGGNPTNVGANANEWVLTDRAVACNNITYTNLNSNLSNVTQSDVIQICVDMDTKKIWFGKNNTFVGSPSAGTGETFSNLPTTITPLAYTNGGDLSLNFGQRPFAYTAPSGFKALCTTNLPEPTIADGSTAMDVALYTGNGSTQTISGLNFSPDFAWLKIRSNVGSHFLFDTVRGATNELRSNSTNAENSLAQSLTAFNSDGFSLGTDNAVNGSSDTYVAWTWDAGSSTVSNTEGSITSQVRANASAGFSVVTYNSGGSTGNFTVGHGLNVAPRLLIHKTRGTGNWWVYHASVIDNLAKYLQLNSTNGVATNSNNMWGAAFPTSSVFGVTVGDLIGTSTDAVVYAFAPVAGYSSMGSYVGNANSDGPFIFTGFRPKLLLIKSSTTVRDWVLYDTSRSTYNTATARLVPNSSSAEGTSANIDILSNGFKIRSGSGSGFEELNESGATIVYAAWAENPFAYSRAR